MDLMALYKFEETLKVVNTDKKESDDTKSEEGDTNEESDKWKNIELEISPDVT